MRSIFLRTSQLLILALSFALIAASCGSTDSFDSAQKVSPPSDLAFAERDTDKARGSNPSEPTNFDVVLMSGQSNMGGVGQWSEVPESHPADFSDTVLFTNRVRPESPLLLDPFQNLGPIAFNDDLLFGPEISMARKLHDHGHEKLAVVKWERPATNVDQWQPGATGTYNGFLWQTRRSLDALIEAGHDFKVLGFVWFQGEGDTHTMEPSQYQTYLESMINGYIGELEADYPGKFANLNTILVEPAYPRGRAPSYNVLRAFVDHSDIYPNTAIVRTVDIDDYHDDIHFGTDGQLNIGRRIADTLQLFNGNSPSGN